MLGLADRLGTFARGMDWSFIELARDGPTPATACEAILHGPLQMTEAGLDPWWRKDGPMTATVRRLRDDGLDWGHDLATLDADVRATAKRLERRDLRVTLGT